MNYRWFDDQAIRNTVVRLCNTIANSIADDAPLLKEQGRPCEFRITNGSKFVESFEQAVLSRVRPYLESTDVFIAQVHDELLTEVLAIRGPCWRLAARADGVYIEVEPPRVIDSRISNDRPSAEAFQLNWKEET